MNRIAAAIAEIQRLPPLGTGGHRFDCGHAAAWRVLLADRVALAGGCYAEAVALWQPNRPGVLVLRFLCRSQDGRACGISGRVVLVLLHVRGSTVIGGQPLWRQAIEVLSFVWTVSRHLFILHPLQRSSRLRQDRIRAEVIRTIGKIDWFFKQYGLK